MQRDLVIRARNGDHDPFATLASASFSGFLLLSAILAGVGQALLQAFRSILF